MFSHLLGKGNKKSSSLNFLNCFSQANINHALPPRLLVFYLNMFDRGRWMSSSQYFYQLRWLTCLLCEHSFKAWKLLRNKHWHNSDLQTPNLLSAFAPYKLCSNLSWHRVVELTCTWQMHMGLPDLSGNPNQGTPCVGPRVQNFHLLNPISVTH